MNSLGLKFHHLGLATRMPELAASMLSGLGYRKTAGPVYDSEQNVNVAMYNHEQMPDVEVIYAAEQAENNPLTAILKSASQLVYHICYETQDHQKSVEAIRGSGLRVIPVSPQKPAVLFDGRTVSFHMVVGFGLIELVQA